MLTKKNLEQIRNIISQEVETKLKNELKPIKKKLNNVSQDLSYVIKSFDERISHSERDINIIKHHIGVIH